jgi:phosphatidylserine decarboxylase
MTIHKEGRKLLVNLLVILVVVNLLFSYFFPEQRMIQNILLIAGVCFYVTILQFFRSPKIKAKINPRHILAPADGKVVVIEDTLETEYFNEKRKQISIFMSPLNVHVNRNPVSGIVKYFKYHAGEYLVAWHPKSSTDNERTTTVVEAENGIEVMFRQVAGALARRIKWYITPGDAVTQGDEFGFIKFGSRIDIYLPLDAKVKVDIGQKTKAGRTIIAELPE